MGTCSSVMEPVDRKSLEVLNLNSSSAAPNYELQIPPSVANCSRFITINMAVFDNGDVVGNKYQVLSSLPVGTIGRSYAVRLFNGDRMNYVFKVINFSSRQELVDGVREEQTFLTKLQHRNILPIFDVLEDEEHENMIIVTECVPRRSVQSLIENIRGSPEKIRKVLHDVAVGLRVLHSNHIFHFNLKLNNVLEMHPNVYCIGDAGFSQIVSAQSSLSLAFNGEAACAPPEVFSDSWPHLIQGCKFDVWGFGLLIYELTFGFRYYDFEGKTAHEIEQMVCHEAINVEPHPNCSMELIEVMKWCLQKDPRARPSISKILRHPYFISGSSQSFLSSSCLTMSRTSKVHNDSPNFSIDCVLGKGIHAETFLVHLKSTPQNLFAFKVMDESIPERIERAVQRGFNQESIIKAVALSRLFRHPNIANYFEIVDGGKGSFVTQPYLRLHNLSMNHPAIGSMATVQKILADVLKGLLHLHDNGVYHLNIKPSNVFYGEKGSFVLTDFGPVMRLPHELYDPSYDCAALSLPSHVTNMIAEPGGLQFVDTYSVGVIALASVPNFRSAVWEKFQRLCDSDLDPIPLIDSLGTDTPVQFLNFLQKSLLTCCTARQLLSDPFLSPLVLPDDIKATAVLVSASDLDNAIRSKFHCKEESRLVDVLGHVPFSNTLESLCPMDSNGSFSSSEELKSSVAISAQSQIEISTGRISYAFDDSLLCGQCKKELTIVLSRCPICAEYVRCGKCASVDSHIESHMLEPYIIESIQNFDEGGFELKCAVLVPPASISKHALEELEMQADLPAGTLTSLLLNGLTKTFSKLIAKKKEASSCSRIPTKEKPKLKLLSEAEANADRDWKMEYTLCKDNEEPDLMLNALELKAVPVVVFTLTHILSLELSNNLLSSVPEALSSLRYLRKLFLASNNISELPKSIGKLKDLMHLDISHNKVSTLPDSIKDCSKLDTIAMDYNRCDEIPLCVLEIRSLKVLYLAENCGINEFPPVEKLQNLGQLKLALDNEPKLFSMYQSIKDEIPEVGIIWNKIYPDEIIKNLYCGSLRSAQSMTVYGRLNIKYLLTVGRGLEPTVPGEMEHKVIIIDDIEGATIDSSFTEAVDFIAKAMKDNKGCLVHCFAGMSRSATTVIAYLMMQNGMRLDAAYCLTKRGRPAIYPNDGFFKQLITLDAKLFPGQRPLDIPSMDRGNIPCA